MHLLHQAVVLAAVQQRIAAADDVDALLLALQSVSLGGEDASVAEDVVKYAVTEAQMGILQYHSHIARKQNGGVDVPDRFAGACVQAGNDDPPGAALGGIVHRILDGLGIGIVPKAAVVCANGRHRPFSFACL